ncbi:exosortase F system-associated protein [Flavobacterium plurextorum]|uniref:exosortase F system-associated membrane protein n=1 Tax=Flavobacterium TaxID=237 RepID=UPI000C198058|nr:MULTISPECIES: exosortase F system-associated protein [Flavobacterium]PIF69356.1 exosortase F-associated protein [Flavobacterium sp. 2]UUW10541.1 exosortase F system-associated protein [Flavobacterium plurextorum]
MLNRFKEHRIKIFASIIIVLCFVLIRALEASLFYDPFLQYFESDFSGAPFPNVDVFRLFCNLLFRFALNTVLSLMLIYVLFKDLEILKFTGYLFLFFFLVLFSMFFIIIQYFQDSSWALFYVRRFIIQPLLVLLFIPAFYYQLQNLKK